MKKSFLFSFILCSLIIVSCEDDADKNSMPVANAGSDLNSFVGDTVNLIGTNSYDEDNNQLTYDWTLLVKPDNSTVELVGNSEDTTVLIPDVGGDYVVSLVVNDGVNDSEMDSVVINVKGIVGTWARTSEVAAGPYEGYSIVDTILFHEDLESYESYSYMVYETNAVFTIGLKGSVDYNVNTHIATNFILTEVYSFNWDFDSPDGEWVMASETETNVVDDYQSIISNQIIEFVLSNNGITLTQKVDFNGDGDLDDVTGSATDDAIMIYSRVE